MTFYSMLEKRGRAINFVRKLKDRKERKAPEDVGVFSTLKQFLEAKRDKKEIIGGIET
jgi:hypothetical protein